jgi:hypothetical protein
MSLYPIAWLSQDFFRDELFHLCSRCKDGCGIRRLFRRSEGLVVK